MLLLHYDTHRIITDSIANDDKLPVFNRLYGFVFFRFSQLDVGHNLVKQDDSCSCRSKAARLFELNPRARTFNRRIVRLRVVQVVVLEVEVAFSCRYDGLVERTDKVRCGEGLYIVVCGVLDCLQIVEDRVLYVY